jgi:hypothetical protein
MTNGMWLMLALGVVIGLVVMGALWWGPGRRNK